MSGAKNKVGLFVDEVRQRAVRVFFDHEHEFIRPNHDIDKDFNPVEYFTVTANRTAPLPP